MDSLLLYLSVCVATAMLLLLVLRWRYPHWSGRRMSAVAALPVPVATMLVCLYVAAKTMLTPRTQCGVDACGMALGFSMVVAIIAVLGFLVTLAICLAVTHLRRKRA